MSRWASPRKYDGRFFGRMMARIDMGSHGTSTPAVPRTLCTSTSSMSQSIPTSRQRVVKVCTPLDRSMPTRFADWCISSSYQYDMCTSEPSLAGKHHASSLCVSVPCTNVEKHVNEFAGGEPPSGEWCTRPRHSKSPNE
jgi:hypothetical protein